MTSVVRNPHYIHFWTHTWAGVLRGCRGGATRPRPLRAKNESPAAGYLYNQFKNSQFHVWHATRHSLMLNQWSKCLGMAGIRVYSNLIVPNSVYVLLKVSTRQCDQSTQEASKQHLHTCHVVSLISPIILLKNILSEKERHLPKQKLPSILFPTCFARTGRASIISYSQQAIMIKQLYLCWVMAID